MAKAKVKRKGRKDKRTGKGTRTRSRSLWDYPEDRVDTVPLGGNSVARCCAPRRRSDPPRRCKKPSMHGKSVCRTHGGTSPGAPIRHGLYMQSLGPLRAAFEAYVQDPGLKDVDRGLATMDAWVSHLMGLSEEGDGLGFRTRALELFENLADAEAGDGDHRKAMLALRRHLASGDKSLRTMDKAMAVVDRRQAHVSSALAISLRADQVVAHKQLLAVLKGVAAIILREVPKDAGRIIDAVTAEVLAGSAGGAGSHNRLAGATLEAGQAGAL